MSYFSEIVNELYNKLVRYYKKNKNEFFTMRNTNHVDHLVRDCFYKMVNEHENFLSVYYEHLARGILDVDFVGDILEKTTYINVKHNNNRFDNSPVWKNFYNQENNNLLKEIHRIIYTQYVMNEFIKKVRLYYLRDFMHNSEISRELLVFKAEINNIYPKINHVIKISDYSNEKGLINDLYENKMNLLDKVSDIIDGEFFKELVLKQQEFYVKELTRLQEVISKEGNKFRCSDKAFLNYLEFISKFKQSAEEKVATLSSSEKMMKKSI